MLSQSPSRSLRGSLLNTDVVMFHLCITLPINKSDGTHVKVRYATFNTSKCASAGPKGDLGMGSHKLRHSAVSGKSCFHCLMSLVREAACLPSQISGSIKPLKSAISLWKQQQKQREFFTFTRACPDSEDTLLLSSTVFIWASDVPNRPPYFLLRNLTVFTVKEKQP